MDHTLSTFRRVSTGDGYGAGYVLRRDESVELFTFWTLDLSGFQYRTTLVKDEIGDDNRNKFFCAIISVTCK